MYCSQGDLIKRFGEEELIDLTDRAGNNTVDADRINEVVTEATSIINGYLQGRVQLPLVDVPGSIKGIACDITRYHLYTNDKPDAVEAGFKSAISFLKDVAAGRVMLGVESGKSVPVPSDNGVVIESHGSVFSRPNSKSFI